MKSKNINYIFLADILANGVAIMLILIIVSLVIKQQDVENELTQIDEIGSVMSRDVANSLVLNSLPSSRPAILHDYEHERDISFPYVILHKEGVTLKGNGFRDGLNLTLNKQALLQQNNAFDRFLQQLAQNQKNYIRMDILHIRHYYLVMSIMKEYNIEVRDWHFLGTEHTGSGDDTQQNTPLSDITDTQLESTSDILTDLIQPSGEEGTSIESDAQFFNSEELFVPPQTQPNAAGRGSGSGSGGGGYGRGNSQSQQDEPSAESFLDIFNQAREDFLMRFSPEKGISNQKLQDSLEVKFANGESLSFSDLITEQMPTDDSNNPLATNAIAKLLLLKIFGYLAAKNEQIYEYRFSEITPADFQAYQVPATFDSDSYQQIINRLYQDSGLANTKTIELAYQPSSQTYAIVDTNNHIDTITLRAPVALEFVAGDTLSLKLYTHSTIEPSQHIPLNPGDSVLTALNKGSGSFIPVAIISKDLTDINMGFLSAKLMEDELFIDTNSELQLANIALPDSSNTLDNSSLAWQYLPYAGLIIAIIMFLIMLMRMSKNEYI